MYPKLKVTYWNMSGRAEAIRLALFISNIPFEDERVSREAYHAMKPNLPYHQFPVMTIDEKVVAQSQAMLRYAGSLGGLYPTTDRFAATQVDEVLCAVDDMGAAIGPSFVEKNEEKKMAMRKELAEVTFPHLLSQIDARLATMNESEIFSNEIHVHDLQFYATDLWFGKGVLDGIPKDITSKYPNWRKSCNKVASNPRVKAWNTIQHGAPKLKLTYFNGAGRAEASRLAFFIGGVEFEDHRINFEDFSALKPTLPYGQLPILEVNGKVVSQSSAILRYAGSCSGLYPKNDLMKALQIDEIVDQALDITNLCSKLRFTKDDNARDPLIERVMPMIAALDSRLSSFGTPYAVGSELTVADLAINSIMTPIAANMVPGLSSEVLESCKTLSSIVSKVQAHSKVIEWNHMHLPSL